MYRSLLSKVGGTLKRVTTTIVNGESSSSSSLLAPPAKYFSRIQNQNVSVISNSRVSSTFSSFSTSTSNKSNVTSDSDSEFVVSYLINSCGLSETEALAASEKLNFKTRKNPDSVLKMLKSHGFTESHISKIVSKVPSILQSNNPKVTIENKLDFYKSKGISEIEIPDFISSFPGLLTLSFNKQIIPCIDALKSLVQSYENLVKMIKRNPWIINAEQVRRMMVNVEFLRNEGVLESNLCLYLIKGPRTFNAEGDKFKEIVKKVKEMGFDPSQVEFLLALHVFRMMTEASLRKKMDVYKRLGGWSEDQIQSAFRKSPTIMKTSDTRIMEVLNFLVNEMGYDSSIVAENAVIFTCSLHRIFSRCSVIRVLVSRGLIKENISLSTLATLPDESFLEPFVEEYEQEVPGLMKVFGGQLNYQELLQN